jgi:hypothetical protein
MKIKFNDFLNEDINPKYSILNKFKIGDKVIFKENTYKDIMNVDIELGGLVGTVTDIKINNSRDWDYIYIKLDKYFEILDEWDNNLIYMDDEFEELENNIEIYAPNYNPRKIIKSYPQEDWN